MMRNRKDFTTVRLNQIDSILGSGKIPPNKNVYHLYDKIKEDYGKVQGYVMGQQYEKLLYYFEKIFRNHEWEGLIEDVSPKDIEGFDIEPDCFNFLTNRLEIVEYFLNIKRPISMKDIAACIGEIYLTMYMALLNSTFDIDIR